MKSAIFGDSRIPSVFGLVFLCLVFLSPLSCSAEDVEVSNAIKSYQTKRDYQSLKTLYQKISVGEKCESVFALLGEPDYSPIEGQYYFSSDQQSQSKNTSGVLGLVVDCIDQNGVYTGKVEALTFGPIGE